MIRQLPTLTATVLVAAFLTACGANDKVRIQDGGTRPSVIEKGTEPVPTITSDQDLYLHAFNELGWSLRSSKIAINGVRRDSREGCITYRKGQRDTVVALVDFACTTTEILGEADIAYRKVLSGRETYTERSPDSLQTRMTATFEQSLYRQDNRKLVARGSVKRAISLTRPARSQNEYSFVSSSSYLGIVALDSNRQGETWRSELDSPRFTDDVLANGSELKFEYTPERPRDEKANKLVTLEIQASEDITFANPGGVCHRPVGTFSYILTRAGSTVSGTLTASANGIVLSTGGRETIPWGSRCLER